MKQIYKTYLFEYEYKRGTKGFRISAPSMEDALDQYRYMQNAKCIGTLVERIPAGPSPVLTGSHVQSQPQSTCMGNTVP